MIPITARTRYIPEVTAKADITELKEYARSTGVIRIPTSAE